MTDNYIPNAVIGGLLVSIGTALFTYVHDHALNFSEVLWTMTVLKPKYVMHYIPVITGLFVTSGILFDWMGYQSFGKVTPYGQSDLILTRTSMYGFALGGFCMGLGAKLAEGDILYHAFSQILLGKWFSLFVVGGALCSANLVSWILGSGYINFFADPSVNPLMEFLHIESANITIGLGILIFTLNICCNARNIVPRRKAVKIIGVSLLSGILIGVGYGICGLAIRSLVFAGLTPGSQWNSLLLIFVSVGIAMNVCLFSVMRVLGLKGVDRQRMIEVGQTVLEGHNGRILIGGLLMGCGWGIAGLDFVTYLIHSAIFSIPVVIIFGGFLILGTAIGDGVL